MKPLFVGRGSLRVSILMSPHSEGCRGAYSVPVERTCIHAYVHMSVCLSVHDPVRLRLTFLYQVALNFISH